MARKIFIIIWMAVKGKINTPGKGPKRKKKFVLIFGEHYRNMGMKIFKII